MSIDFSGQTYSFMRYNYGNYWSTGEKGNQGINGTIGVPGYNG